MLVSICIPCFEDLKKLQRAINSIFSQKEVCFEIIISDDSRTSLIEEYISGLDDKRIYYTRNARKISSTSNWNNALSKASGDILILLHHDDYFLHQKSLFRIVQEFNDPVVKMVWSNFENENGLYNHFFSGKFCFYLIQKFPETLFAINYLSTPSCMAFRSSVAARYNEELISFVDVEFYTRCMLSYSGVSYIHESLIGIGADHNRITSSMTEVVRLHELEILALTGRFKFKNMFIMRLSRLVILGVHLLCYYINRCFRL
jgi:glycosyltransferase involved in cell wall biosynthesis